MLIVEAACFNIRSPDRHVLVRNVNRKIRVNTDQERLIEARYQQSTVGPRPRDLV